MKRIYKSFCMVIAITIFLTSLNVGVPFINISSNIVNAETIPTETIPTEAVWIPRESGTTQSISDIVYGNGIFVAVGNAGTILTSEDGVSWTQQDSTITTNLHKIVFSGSLFVTIGGSGTILTSNDGITWTKRTSGTSIDLKAIAYGGGTYITTGELNQDKSLKNAFILKSNNGTAWIKQENINSYGTVGYLGLIQASYMNGRFIIGGNYGNVIVSTNSTADTWESKRVSTFNGNSGEAVFGNGIYIVPVRDDSKPNEILISENDAVSFTHINNQESGYIAKFYNDKFYIGGQNGLINVVNTTGDALALEWEIATTPTTSSTIKDLEFYGSKYYAIGTAGLVMESSDGLNWITVASGTTNTLNKMALSDSIIAIVGANGTIITKRLNGTVTDDDIVDIEKFYLTSDHILDGNASLDNITTKLNLITESVYTGTTIGWTSDKPDVISSDGIVTRPAYNQTDQSVALTATISYGSANVDKVFNAIVIKSSDNPDIADVEADMEALTISFSGEDSASSVTQRLKPLPSGGSNGTIITWASTASSILSHDGQTLERPLFNETDTDVLMIATITKGEISRTKDFILTIKKLVQTDEEAVAADKDALNILFASGDSDISVTQDLGHPSKIGANGTIITWASNNTEVLSDGGQIVSRPAYTGEDVMVELTATITKNKTSDTKIFKLTVKKLAQTDEAAVAADIAAIDITYILNGNAGSDKVTDALLLPITGENETIIAWHSSDTAIIADNGMVTRPLYSTGNTAVILTATITKNIVSETREFAFTVVKAEITDAEAVAADMSLLDARNILNENESLIKITGDLILPVKGFYNTNISWNSSDSSVIASNGAVSRPNYTSGDTDVTVTATITKGAATNTKSFMLKVTKLPDMSPPGIVSTNPPGGSDGVSLFDNIEILFDEEIKLVNTSKIKLQYSQKKKTWYLKTYYVDVSETITVKIDDTDNQKLIIDPSGKTLKGKTKYTVVLAAGSVADLNDNAITEYTFSFTTGKEDDNKPKITGTSPSDGEKNVKAERRILITFNENIYQSDSYNNIRLDSSGTRVPMTLAIDGSTLEVIPNKPLEEDKQYRVSFTNNCLEDRSGNKFGGISVMLGMEDFKFTTSAEFNEPVIVSVLPEDKTGRVSVGTSVIIIFNEAIKKGSAFDSIQIVGPDNKNVSYSATIAAEYLILKPNKEMLPNAQYSVKLPANSIKDTAENAMSEQFEYQFKTGANTLNLLSAQPEIKNNEVSLDTTLLLKFERDIQEGSAFSGISLKDQDDNPVSFTTSIYQGNMMISPEGLKQSTRYFMTLSKDAVKDNEGSSNDEAVITFKTAAPLNTGWKIGGSYERVYQLEGEPVSFDATGLTDRYQRAGRKVLDYHWEFGDGGTADGEKQNHTYTNAGLYSVTLTIFDDKGISTKILGFASIKENGNYIKMEVSPEGTLNIPRTVYDEFEGRGRVDKTYFVKLSKEDLPFANQKVRAYVDGASGYAFFRGLTTDSNGYASFEVGGAWMPDDTYTVTFIYSYGNKEFRESRQLIIQPYDNDIRIGGIRIIHKDMPTEVISREVKIDGEIVGHTWPSEEDNLLDFFLYEGKSIESGKHTIELSDITAFPFYRYGGPQEIILLEDGQIIDYTIEEYIPSEKPVVTRIRTNMSSDTSNGEDGIVFKIGEPIYVDVMCNWAGHQPGYYKYIWEDINGQEKSIVMTQYSYGKLYPDETFKEAGRLKVVACSANGTESMAMDANVVFASPPPTSTVKYIDVPWEFTDRYEISTMQTMPGAESDSMPKFPLLGGSTLGVSTDHFALEGSLDDEGKLSLAIKGKGEKGKTKSKNKMLKDGKSKELEIAGITIEGALGGQMFWQYNTDTGNWDFAGGGILIEIEGSAQYTQHFTVAIIPCYLRGQVALALGTELSILKDFEEGDYDFAGTLSASPSIEIALGAGGGPFTVEGYLAGGFDFGFEFPANEYEIKASITGGIRATAFLLEYEKECLSYEFDIATNKKEEKAMLMRAIAPNNMMSAALFDNPQTGEFKLIGRDYLVEQSEWNGSVIPHNGMRLMGIARSAEAQSGSNITNITLQSSIFPNAKQMVSNAGNNKMVMAFTADNPNRSAVNRTEIKYSVLVNGNWSEAEFMGIDSTADYSPVLAYTQNGAIMVWENTGKILGDDMLSETSELSDTSDLYSLLGQAASSLEISVAMSDDELNGWSGIRNLTDDKFIDHSPRIASDTDSALLVWIKNEGNSIIGSVANPDSIRFSKFEGGNWSEPVKICEAAGAIVDSSVAYDGNSGIYTYTVDADGNFATMDDQEVYAIVYENNSWSSPIRITDNEVQDMNIKSCFVNGKVLVLWYQNGNIVYTYNVDKAPVTVPTIETADGRFEMAVSRTGQVALVYTETSNGAQNIYTTFYDSINDVWSEQIQLTNNENSIISTLSPAFDDEGRLAVAYSKAGLFKNVVDGIEYTNIGNTDLCIATLTPRHDLAVVPESIVSDVEMPLPGTTVNISAEIINEGEYTEKDFEVAFYAGDPLNGGQRIGDMIFVSQPITPRASVFVQTDWAIPLGTNITDVYVVVDPQKKIADADESNNSAHNSIIRAELVLTGIDYQQGEDTGFNITAHVMNTGSVSVNNAGVSLYESDEEGSIVGSTETGPFAPGMTKSVKFTWDSTGKPFENNRYMMVAKVDAQGVEEYSIDNNIYYGNIKARTLSVKRYEPGNNDTDVAIDAKVTLEFNLGIMEGELYKNIVIIDSLGNSVPFTKSLNKTQLILTPSEKLKNSEAYAIQVPVDAVNGFDGCGMKQDYIMSFTTEKLYTSPMVKFTYPADDMTDVPINSDINIRFSGNIKAGDQYAGITVSDVTGKPISMTKTIDGELLKIHPSAKLTDNTIYIVNIPEGAVAYRDGVLMERDYKFSFTTGEGVDNPGPGPEPKPDPEPQPGGSSAGGGAGPSKSDEPVVSTEEGINTVTISANVESNGEVGVITATVDNDELESALSKARQEMDGKAGAKGQIAIDIGAEDAKEVNLQIPKEALGKIENTQGMELKLNSALATVKFDQKALNNISGTGDADKSVDDISFTIKKVNPDTHTKEAQDKVGDRPVIDFKVSVGDKRITSFGGGTVTISIPYTPKSGEKHNSIVIYYIDSDGKLSKGMGQYNIETGTVDFTTDHFSSYGVGYNEVRFSDVAEDSWYNNAIGYLAARSMINGSGNGIFAPEVNISRADFLIMVMNVYGIKLDDTITDNFTDAGNKYYTPYLGTAKRLNLVAGGGNNLYSPESNISRQDMAVILYRILKQLDKLPTKKSYPFDKFRDTVSISGYATEAMKLFAETGILAGDGINLNPRDTSTRAQAAQILYNLQK